jgi:hypothetical protein
MGGAQLIVIDQDLPIVRNDLDVSNISEAYLGRLLEGPRGMPAALRVIAEIHVDRRRR